MKKKFLFRRILLVVLVLGVVVGAVLGGYMLGPGINRGPKAMQMLDGIEVKFLREIVDEAGISDTTILVLHWNVDCPYCLEQIEEAKFLRIPTIYINCGDSKRAVEKYIRKHGMDKKKVVIYGKNPASGFPYVILVAWSEMAEEWAVITEWVGVWTGRDISSKISEWEAWIRAGGQW